MTYEPQRTATDASPEALLAKYLYRKGSPEQTFGARVRQLRTARRWPQQELVYRMAEHGFAWRQNTVARTESANRPIALNEAAALARIFDVQIQALLIEPAGREEFEALAAHVRATQTELAQLEEEAYVHAARLADTKELARRTAMERDRVESIADETRARLGWLRQQLAQTVLEEDHPEEEGT